MRKEEVLKKFFQEKKKELGRHFRDSNRKLTRKKIDDMVEERMERLRRCCRLAKGRAVTFVKKRCRDCKEEYASYYVGGEIIPTNPFAIPDEDIEEALSKAAQKIIIKGGTFQCQDCWNKMAFPGAWED